MALNAVQEFIGRHGIDDIHAGTGIPTNTLQKYVNAAEPNVYHGLLLYNFSVERGDTLEALKPQDGSRTVQLAQWLVKHGTTPYKFSTKHGIPERTFRDLAIGITSIDRSSLATKKLIYEGTVEEGEPLEFLRPDRYAPRSELLKEHETVAPIRELTSADDLPKIKPPGYEDRQPEEQLKMLLNNLFDAAHGILPYLRDALDPERLQALASQTNLKHKEQLPAVARNLMHGLLKVLEYEVSAPQEEREAFRHEFYGDRRGAINFAQLVDSLETEEKTQRFQALRKLR